MLIILTFLPFSYLVNSMSNWTEISRIFSKHQNLQYRLDVSVNISWIYRDRYKGGPNVTIIRSRAGH